MFKPSQKLIASCFLALTLLAKAELPSFQETPWLGYFAHGKGKIMVVKISADGLITAHPVGKKGEERPYLKIPFQFSIRKAFPNGKIGRLKFDPKTLKSESKITDKLKEVTITGEAGLGATFEISLLFKRDTLTLGGKVTGTGTEKHPLSFYYQSRLHHFHGQLLRRLKGDQAAFDKIVEKDWFKLHHLDKNKEKRTLVDVFETGDDKTLNGPGSSKVEIEAAIIDKNKRMLIFEAKGPSHFRLIKPKPGPFHQGYLLDWTFDQTKDKDDEARLTFEVDSL